MATYDDVVKSTHQTLSGSTADTVNVTQFWDGIEIENRHTTNAMYVRFDGTTAVAAAAGTEYIGPEKSKHFTGGIYTGGGLVGNNTTPPHKISIVGTDNPYSVTGVAGEA